MTKDKKVLIIGGTSSLSPAIISELELSGHTIDLMTFRQERKKYGEYNWVHLKLEDNDSVKRFVQSLPDEHYSKIIFTIGNTVGVEPGKEILENDLKLFYESFVFRTIYIINKCIKSLKEDGHFVFISSVAANHPMGDPDYSAVKAAVQAFVRSLSTKLKPNQVAFSIAPGQIHDTEAYYLSDYKWDIDKIWTKEKIAKAISKADVGTNGKVLENPY
jgi:NAD(P)-dependent dehydrogenase (short-subunit alcohol dehydrogenase family)